jgi:hypothetical protein
MSQVVVNQQTGGERWHALGLFAFRPGSGQGVTLSGDADGVVVADAVAWVGPRGTDARVGLTDLAAVQPLQRTVDVGDQPWRLDPLDVARADATVLGFGPTDPMELVEEKTGSARVRAQHAGATYDIQVVQPARLGPTGVWIVESVRGVGPANVCALRPDPAPQPPVRRPKYSLEAAVAEPKSRPTLEQLLEPKPDTGGARETPEQYREHCARVIDGLKASGWPHDLVKQVEADMHDRVHRVYVLDIKRVQESLGISRYGVDKLVKDGKIRQFTIAPQYRDQKPTVRIPVVDVLTLR